MIDTVGIKTRPYTMVDQFGTPHTDKLHVIERYRLIDYETANQLLERGAKENASFVRNDSGGVVDLNDKGKHLLLEFTVEDPGAFTTPWSARVIYRPGASMLCISSRPLRARSESQSRPPWWAVGNRSYRTADAGDAVSQRVLAEMRRLIERCEPL